MGRQLRNTVGDSIYHALNRANNRSTIFHKDLDYIAFEKILEEGKEKHPIRLLSYELMPNHWHLVLKPYNTGDLSKFIKWITLTHTQRYNKHYQRVGYGQVYQGRFKSFLVETDAYFLQLCRYIESNALRAGLVEKAEDWKWSSLWRRMYGTEHEKTLLDPWPIEPGEDYLKIVNQRIPEGRLKSIRLSILKNTPLKDEEGV